MNITHKNRPYLLFKLTLERTPDLDVQECNQETPLHYACFRGEPETARLLLDHGAKVNVKNYQGETPLHLVSRDEYNSPDDGVCVAELLLERGADVHAQTQWGETPLHAASSNGKVKIAQLLLDKYGANVDTVDAGGNTPLHVVSRGHYGTEEVNVGIARLLLERGADVNARDRREFTPLHVSCKSLMLEITRLLLKHGAEVDAEDSTGKTPIGMTLRYNNKVTLDIAQLLLEYGADRSVGGSTLLHWASYKGQLEIAHRVLDSGAKVNVVDSNGATPLHITAFRGNTEIAGLLLAHGAEVDAKDDRGNTPLHYVSRGEYHPSKIYIACLLFEHGADVNAKDRFGKSPLDQALKMEREDIAQFLLENGGRPGASSRLIDFFKR